MFTTTQDNQANTVMEFDTITGTDKPIIIIPIPSNKDQIKVDKKAATAAKRADAIAKRKALKALKETEAEKPEIDINKTSILEDQGIHSKALKARAEREKAIQDQVLALDLWDGITAREFTEYCVATGLTRKLEQVKVNDHINLVYLVGTTQDTELGKMFVDGVILLSVDQGDNYIAIGKIGSGNVILDNDSKASKIHSRIIGSVVSELDRQLAKRDQQAKTKLENLKREQEKINSLVSRMKTRKPLI